MSWKKIKEKCSFENGELIQVCFADEYIKQLEQQNAELVEALVLRRDYMVCGECSEYIGDGGYHKESCRHHKIEALTALDELTRIGQDMGDYTYKRGD